MRLELEQKSTEIELSSIINKKPHMCGFLLSKVLCYYVYMKLTRTRLYFIVFFIVAASIIGFLSTVSYKGRLTIVGKTFVVDVSDTSYTMTRGLSDRESLSSDSGMVFIFGTSDKHGFWMKNMLFPIDIIWMDENLVVNHIEKSVSPLSYPKTYYPNSPSLYVLEVKAGESDRLGLKVGDKA